VEWWVLADQGENALSRGHPNADSARDVWPFRATCFAQNLEHQFAL
jgi:hypothetical protein